MKALKQAQKKSTATMFLLASIILDALSTAALNSNPSTRELNPFVAGLIEGTGFLSTTLMLLAMPILFSIIIFHLWATPTTKYTGRNTIYAIATSKTLAGINNSLLLIGEPYPNIIPFIYIPTIILPLHGILKDLERG